MSLYADYLRERTTDLILEDPKGFATYRYIDDKTVYIVDIYVVPEARKQGFASELANLIAEEAKAKGCTSMLGSVVPSAKGSTTSLKVLLGYGMRLDRSGDNYIFFRKDL